MCLSSFIEHQQLSLRPSGELEGPSDLVQVTHQCSVDGLVYNSAEAIPHTSVKTIYIAIGDYCTFSFADILEDQQTCILI